MIYPWTSPVSILTKLLKTSTPLLYIFADDTSLNIIVEDPIHTADQLNSDLAKLHRWAHKWLVSFNPGMSECIRLSMSCQFTLRSVVILYMMCKLHYDDDSIVKTRGGGGGAWNSPLRKMMVF